MHISDNITREAAAFSLPAGLIADTPDHTIAIASEAFLQDTFQNFFTRTYLNLPPLSSTSISSFQPITVEQIKKVLADTLSGFLQSGAFLVASPECPTVTSIWELKKPSNTGPSGHARGIQISDDGEAEKQEVENEDLPLAVHELAKIVDPVWRSEFPTQTVLHLALVGNTVTSIRPASTPSPSSITTIKSTTHKPKGASHIITRMCQQAQIFNIPVILEASSPKSRDVYANRGFKLVKEVRIAVGLADCNGNNVFDHDDNGNAEGFPLYLMRFDP